MLYIVFLMQTDGQLFLTAIFIPGGCILTRVKIFLKQIFQCKNKNLRWKILQWFLKKTAMEQI